MRVLLIALLVAISYAQTAHQSCTNLPILCPWNEIINPNKNCMEVVCNQWSASHCCDPRQSCKEFENVTGYSCSLAHLVLDPDALCFGIECTTADHQCCVDESTVEANENDVCDDAVEIPIYQLNSTTKSLKNSSFTRDCGTIASGWERIFYIHSTFHFNLTLNITTRGFDALIQIVVQSECPQKEAAGTHCTPTSEGICSFTQRYTANSTMWIVVKSISTYEAADIILDWAIENESNFAALNPFGDSSDSIDIAMFKMDSENLQIMGAMFIGMICCLLCLSCTCCRKIDDQIRTKKMLHGRTYDQTPTFTEESEMTSRIPDFALPIVSLISDNDTSEVTMTHPMNSIYSFYDITPTNANIPGENVFGRIYDPDQSSDKDRTSFMSQTISSLYHHNGLPDAFNSSNLNGNSNSLHKRVPGSSEVATPLAVTPSVSVSALAPEVDPALYVAESTRVKVNRVCNASGYVTSPGTPEYVISKTELQFVEPVGQGSFGQVWRGFYRGGECAIKRCTADTLEYIHLEANVLRTVRRHPNILGFYGICTDPGSESLILEFFAGGSVQQMYTSSDHKISMNQKMHILRQAAAGINHLHQNDPPIIHRDIACRNLLINSQHKVVVADFGLSRQDNHGGTGDQTLTDFGPIRWMSPESMLKHKYSSASDVWAFASMAYELLEEKLPYYELTNPNVVIAITNHEIPECREHWDYALVDLLQQCWSFKPEDRPNMLEAYNRILVILGMDQHIMTPTNNGKEFHYKPKLLDVTSTEEVYAPVGRGGFGGADTMDDAFFEELNE